MLTTIFIIIGVIAVIVIICALTKPTDRRCIHCDIPTDPAPCGAMLCERCCARCNTLQTRPCRYMRAKGDVMEGQEEFD